MKKSHRSYCYWNSTLHWLGIFAISFFLLAPIHAVGPERASSKCLSVKWREYQSKIPSELGGYLEIKAEKFPTKYGPLTLNYSTSLWEQFFMQKSGRMIKSRIVNGNAALARSMWDIYLKYGDRIHHVALHTQPYPFYMPGEQATVELFNDSRSWVETVKITPHPLVKALDTCSIEAQLVSLHPLKYELELIGVKDHETIQITTLPSISPLHPRKLKSDPKRKYCILELNEKTQKGLNFIDLSVNVENGPTLQLQLPTIHRLSQLQRESVKVAHEMLGS